MERAEAAEEEENVSEIPMKYYWMGKDVETLSRDQLLHAVMQLARQLDSTRVAYRSVIDMLDMEREIREHNKRANVA